MEAAKILGITKSESARLIEPIKDCQLERIASRPLYTPMKCLISEQIGFAPIRDWRKALAAYINNNC